MRHQRGLVSSATPSNRGVPRIRTRTTGLGNHDVPLVVATGNPHKVDELRALLAGLPVRLVGLGDVTAAGGAAVEMPDETGDTFEANADLKAAHVARATGMWALADDSGFEVPALGGRPGVISARYAGAAGTREEIDRANNRKLVAEARAAGLFASAAGGAGGAGRPPARFRCVLSVARPDGGIACRGEGACEGVLTEEARGSGGFGYDPHFVVPALGRSFAELGPAEKNRVSHRARAAADLRARLAAVLARPT